MDYYGDKERELQIVGSETIFEIRTPGYVLAEMNTVNAAVTNLVTDMNKSPLQGGDLAQSFVSFVKEWRVFYKDNSEGVAAWAGRGTSSVYNKTIEYRNRLVDFVNAFRKAGGKTTFSYPDKKRSSSFWRWAPWVLLGGLGIGWYLTREGD